MQEEMIKTRGVRISVAPSSDQYEWNDDFSSSSSSSSSLHVFRFSVEERHRLIAPSWFTSKHIEDYDDDGEDDDDIVQEVIQQSVLKDFEFSNDDFRSRAYEKSVSDFISTVEFLSNDAQCVKFLEDSLFRWVESVEMTDDVFCLKVDDVKIVVLIREETNGEGFTGEEFDGEDEEEVEMAPAPAPAPAPQVEVDQEVIQIEDDEEEVGVPVVEEYDNAEARGLMETVFGSNDYMEVEEPNYDVGDLEGGGGIEQRWEEYIEEENSYFGFSNRMDDGEGERWERYVEVEDNNWFGFSNRNGVSRDMIEASMKTRDYDPKKDGDCMICMDGFSSKQVVAAEMPCSHEFHKPCIVEWLQLKNACPLCRFEISNKDDPL